MYVFLKVTEKWAIDMVAEDPIVVCEKRAVWSDGGGALGHPRVFINLVSASCWSQYHSSDLVLVLKLFAFLLINISWQLINLCHSCEVMLLAHCSSIIEEFVCKTRNIHVIV